ncbi:hypothetical protein M433DRAFT_9466 [Acidomyces richmondensis BFW]|nr:hypothetical protein M433DRAFT_9466 [Acidomyces richmondensis BFW]
MGTSAALMQLQITTLQQANEALHIRRKRKRKAIRSKGGDAKAKEEGIKM